MKIVPNYLLTLGAIMLGTANSFALPEPPPPPSQVPPPFGLPIDANIGVMIFVAVAFGLYKIYRYKSRQVV